MGKRCCKEVLGLKSYKFDILRMFCCDDGFLSMEDAEEIKFLDNCVKVS